MKTASPGDSGGQEYLGGSSPSSPVQTTQTPRGIPLEFPNSLKGSTFDASPKAPTGLPAPPPGNKAPLPPAWQRYATGLKMSHAYANNWQPNPIMLRLLNGK